MNTIERQTVVVVGALAVVTVGAIYLAKKTGDVVSKVGESINPASDQNIAYKAANAVTSVLTGTDTPAGVWLWGLFNPGAVAAEKAALAPSPGRAQQAISEWDTQDPIAGIELAGGNTGGASANW